MAMARHQDISFGMAHLLPQRETFADVSCFSAGAKMMSSCPAHASKMLEILVLVFYRSLLRLNLELLLQGQPAEGAFARCNREGCYTGQSQRRRIYKRLSQSTEAFIMLLSPSCE